jgi:prefoldin subunit 5
MKKSYAKKHDKSNSKRVYTYKREEIYDQLQDIFNDLDRSAESINADARNIAQWSTSELAQLIFDSERFSRSKEEREISRKQFDNQLDDAIELLQSQLNAVAISLSNLDNALEALQDVRCNVLQSYAKYDPDYGD